MATEIIGLNLMLTMKYKMEFSFSNVKPLMLPCHVLEYHSYSCYFIEVWSVPILVTRHSLTFAVQILLFNLKLFVE